MTSLDVYTGTHIYILTYVQCKGSVQLCSYKFHCYCIYVWRNIPSFLHYAFRFLEPHNGAAISVNAKNLWSLPAHIYSPKGLGTASGWQSNWTISDTSLTSKPTRLSVLWLTYCKVSNISHTLVGNKNFNHSDVVGASPVGAAPATSSFTA